MLLSPQGPLSHRFCHLTSVRVYGFYVLFRENAMKVKVGFLFILFVAAMTVLSTFSLAQKDIKNADDPNKIIIDVSSIGKKMGVPEDTIPFVDGKTFQLQRWNKEYILKAIEELKPCFKQPEKTCLLTEVPAPWITLALIQALQPLNVHYLYPAPGGTDLGMIEFKRGEQAQNYGALFEVREDGENVYINLTTDKPSTMTTGEHTFDIKDLPKVIIPDIPSGKNVFIHGKGMYGAMVCIAWNYAKDCKSLSMAAHETDYVCAISFTKEREVGDVTKRTRENNL